MRPIELISLLLFAVIFIGLMALNGGPLAIALLLIVYLSAGILYRPEQVRLEAARDFSAHRIAPGDPLTVTVRVTNRGPDLEEVRLEDALPDAAEVLEGETCVLAEMPGGAQIELVYTIRGQRGPLRFPGLSASARDHFGLSRAKVEGLAPGEIVALPQPLTLKRVAIRPQQTLLAPGLIPARAGGPGIDFFGVRAYQHGDSLRHVNWRTSARHTQSLFTNEFEQERAASVGLILDARRRSNVSTPAGSLFEHKIDAASTLADSLLREGNRVGLLIYGGYLDWTFPGYGKLQRERILHSLASAKMGDSLIFDRIEYLPTRIFPRQSQLILVSELNSDDYRFLIRLRSVGYALTVISPDPVAFEAASEAANPPGLSQDRELGLRLAGLERNLLLSRLRQAGIRIVDWNVSQPFDQAAHAILSRPLPWSHARRTSL